MRRFIHALSTLMLAALLAGPAPGAAREVRWHFAEGVLGMWALQVSPIGKADEHAPWTDPDFPHYRSWRSAAKPGSSALEWQLPGLRLRRGTQELALPAVHLQIDAQRAGVLISDAQGRPWLVADMAHQLPGEQLDWRYLSLRLLPAAARALGEPALERVVLGSLSLRGGPNLSAKGAGDCSAGGNWPVPGQPADIALNAIGFVGAFASRDCSGGPCIEPSPAGSRAGEVVIAPDALLANVGDRDVAWYVKFFPQQNLPPDLPYASDQHPFLVWALYREDADGSLVPLGSSGVKHAFFAQNAGCTCPGDHVLFPGCGDLYSAATNDMASVLGPRSEIDPRSGRWGRCGSVFDPDCDGVQDSSGYAPAFERRLLVAESALLAAEHPGARWFIEAWYVVRDDGNLDNSMAHRQVLPDKSGAGWSFQVSGAPQAGPQRSRWVDPGTPTAQRQARRLALPDGHLQLAVRVDPIGSCRFRYHYALMNLDYAHSSFSGTPPNLRMESSHGLRGLGWEVERTDLAQLIVRDDDRDPSTDWQAAASGPLQLSAPPGAELGWGRMLTLSFDSARRPAPGAVSVQLGDGGSARVELLVPGSYLPAFCDGFESPEPARLRR
jgi:hypothetical protein